MNPKAIPRITKKIVSKEDALPERVTFFVTNECNLRCKHCFFWKDLDKKTDLLTLPEIKEISQTMGNFSSLSLTGGEPFLRKDLAQIARAFRKKSKIKRLSIPTNGTLTEKVINTTEKIAQENPNLSVIVKVSLDGLEATHDKIRGEPGCFQKALETYKNLKELQKTHPNLKLGTLTTQTGSNQNDLNELFNFVFFELGPDQVSLNLIRGETKDSSLKNVNLDLYQKLQRRIRNYTRGILPKIYKKKVTDLITKTVRTNTWQTPCYAGILTAVIRENGNVFPCELLNKKMGNLRDFNYNFNNLWESRQAQEVRKYIKETKCFCHHECTVPVNIFFNPRNWLTKP